MGLLASGNPVNAEQAFKAIATLIRPMIGKVWAAFSNASDVKVTMIIEVDNIPGVFLLTTNPNGDQAVYASLIKNLTEQQSMTDTMSMWVAKGKPIT